MAMVPGERRSVCSCSTATVEVALGASFVSVRSWRRIGTRECPALDLERFRLRLGSREEYTRSLGALGAR